VDFRYSTEQELFRQGLREWVTKNLEPRARQIDEEENGIPDDIVQGLVDLGVFGVTIPEELGGCSVPGEELIYAMIAIHELARGDLSMSTPVYTLLGRKGLGATEFPPIDTAIIDGDLGFRQHTAGHTPEPTWPTFITFAERYFSAPRATALR